MMRIRAGELRSRATILKPSKQTNTDGNPKRNYTAFKTNIPAKLEMLRGRELWEARAVYGESVARLRLRYIADLKADMQITVNGRTYEIMPPIDNVGERNLELVLMIKEIAR